MHSKIASVVDASLRIIAESTRGSSATRTAARQELAAFIASEDYAEHAASHTPLETETFVEVSEKVVRCLIRATVGGTIFVCAAKVSKRDDDGGGSGGALSRARAFLTTIQAQHDAASSVHMSDVSLGDLLASVMDSEIDRRAEGERVRRDDRSAAAVADRRAAPRRTRERERTPPRQRDGSSSSGGGSRASSDPLAALAQQYSQHSAPLARASAPLRASSTFASPATPASLSERAPLAGRGRDVESGGGGVQDVLGGLLAKATGAVDNLRGAARGGGGGTYDTIGSDGSRGRKATLICLGLTLLAALLYGLASALCGRLTLGPCHPASIARGGLAAGVTAGGATGREGAASPLASASGAAALGANATAVPTSLGALVSSAAAALSNAVGGGGGGSGGGGGAGSSGSGAPPSSPAARAVGVIVATLVCFGCVTLCAVVALSSWSRLHRAYDHIGGKGGETVGLAAAGARQQQAQQQERRGRGRSTPRAAIRPVGIGSYDCDEDDSEDGETLAL